MFISLEQLNSANMVASNWTGIDSVVYYFCCWRCLFSPFYYLFIFILDVYYLFKAKQTSILCYSFLYLFFFFFFAIVDAHQRCWSSSVWIFPDICFSCGHERIISIRFYFFLISFSCSIPAYSVVKCVVWMSSIQLFCCSASRLGFMSRVSWPSPRKTDEKKIE